jgi:hypothetical protein
LEVNAQVPHPVGQAINATPAGVRWNWEGAQERINQASPIPA